MITLNSLEELASHAHFDINAGIELLNNCETGHIKSQFSSRDLADFQNSANYCCADAVQVFLVN